MINPLKKKNLQEMVCGSNPGPAIVMVISERWIIGSMAVVHFKKLPALNNFTFLCNIF